MNRPALRHSRPLLPGLLVALAAGLVLAGCAGPTGPAAGRVTGSVVFPRRGLTQCPDCLRPDPARVALTGIGQATRYHFRQVVTASTGKFRVALPPGLYMIRAFTNHVNGGLCRPATFIRVVAGRTIRLRLICTYETG